MCVCACVRLNVKLGRNCSLNNELFKFIINVSRYTTTSYLLVS